MIGIYSINNNINGKRYIGKSKNIERRISAHFSLMKKDALTRTVNRHLFAAAKKYGLENFSWEVLESFDILNENLMADREIFWMEFYNTTDREFGYNLIKDSSSRTIVHPETIEIFKQINIGERNPNYGNYWTDDQKIAMSDIAKQRHADGFYGEEWKKKIGQATSKVWENHQLKNQMARKVGLIKSKYRIYQYDKVTLDLVKVWESMQEIMDSHPDYHKIAIYSVANGHKKSYRGYIWKTELKEPKNNP